MDSTAPISVLVGKAVLTQDGLYVNDRKTDLRDSSEFAAVVMTTQAIIVQALSLVFPDDFGQLSKVNHGHYELAPGLAPWDQYAQSSLKISSTSDSGEIVVGWCVLLHLISRFSKSLIIDPQALLVANFVASQATWSMNVDRDELSAWLDWNAMRNPFASEFEQIRHEEMRPVDPFRSRRSMSVPWIDELGPFSAFDLVHILGGDIMISLQQKIASLHALGNVFVSGKFTSMDVIPDEPRHKDFRLNVEHMGETMRFRAHADQDSAVLRLLPKAFNRIQQGALQ